MWGISSVFELILVSFPMLVSSASRSKVNAFVLLAVYVGGRLLKQFSTTDTGEAVKLY